VVGTAATDRRRLAVDIGRACGALLGRWAAVPGRFGRRGSRAGEAHEYGRDQGAQRQYHQTCDGNLIETLRPPWRRPFRMNTVTTDLVESISEFKIDREGARAHVAPSGNPRH
jgi:hypothetical protein